MRVRHGRATVSPSPCQSGGEGESDTEPSRCPYPQDRDARSLKEASRDHHPCGRSGLFPVMVVCSAAFLAGAVWLGRRPHARFDAWNAGPLAGAMFLVAIGTAMALLPSLGQLAANTAQYGAQATKTPQPLRNPAGAIVHPGFPADTLFAFRLYSVATQLILWTTIGLVFTPLAERPLSAGRDEVARRIPVAG